MTEHIEWQGRFIEVCTVPWRENGQWEYVRRRGEMEAAVILALTDKREIVLVEQYRAPLDRRCLELPAGLIGDTAPGEDPLATAKRELLEETGFRAADWQPLGSFASAPGLVGSIYRFFRATGLERVAKGGGIEGEDITPHVVPLATLPTFVEEARGRGVVIDTRIGFGLHFL